MYFYLNSAVGIFKSPQDAEVAVKELQRYGCDLKKLSIIGGMLVSWILNAQAWASPLSRIGIPESNIHQYENALKTNKFILVFQGSLAEVEKAVCILNQNHAEYARCHSVEFIDE